jgi:hypothetical protein
MPRFEPTYTPTIGYVRSLGIGHLDIWCEGRNPQSGYRCGRYKSLPIEGFDDAVTLVSIASRLRCEGCETVGKVDIRPAWDDAPAQRTEGPSAMGWMTPPAGNIK